MLKAIIFDVDGVLVDSKNANVDFYQRLIRQAGYPGVSAKAVLDIYHLPLKQSIETLTGSTDTSEVSRIVNLARGLYDTSLFEFPAMLSQTLEQLHKKYKLAIVTGRIKRGLDDFFKTSKTDHLFDACVTFDDYANPKPHPEPLLVALKLLGIKSTEAIYIGDSPTDVEAAKAAKMPCIFLNTKKHKDADANIQEFDELLDVLKKFG